MATIGVFCSSADGVADHYHAVADELGRGLAERGHAVLYGGTAVGVMGTLARAAREAGGRVIGVTLQAFVDLGISDVDSDELEVVPTLGARKDRMIARSDAFVVLPGGFGTLDEMVEVISQRQLRLHDRPLVLVDHHGFFAPLLAFFELLHAERMAAPTTVGAYEAVPDVRTALQGLTHLLA